MKNYKRLLNASFRHVALLVTLLCIVMPLTTSAALKEPYSVPDIEIGQQGAPVVVVMDGCARCDP
jgi:hypothetical protein